MQRQRPPRTTAQRPLVDAITAGEVRRIDLLRLTIGDGAQARTRYAHSYIGMGLTPVVAIDLEKGGKGSLKEIVSVVRTFAKFRSTANCSRSTPTHRCASTSLPPPW